MTLVLPALPQQPLRLKKVKRSLIKSLMPEFVDIKLPTRHSTAQKVHGRHMAATLPLTVSHRSCAIFLQHTTSLICCKPILALIPRTHASHLSYLQGLLVK